jgi:hypothetical protein
LLSLSLYRYLTIRHPIERYSPLCNLPGGKGNLLWETCLLTMEQLWFTETLLISLTNMMSTRTKPWSQLQECRYRNFGMAVINDKLVSIGCNKDDQVTNSLISYASSFVLMKMWKEDRCLPPMPSYRMNPAAVSTSTHLIVAGGCRTFSGTFLSTVEVLDIKTCQWSTACNLPPMDGLPQLVSCGGSVCILTNNTLFTGPVDVLLDSSRPSYMWTK